MKNEQTKTNWIQFQLFIIHKPVSSVSLVLPSHIAKPHGSHWLTSDTGTSYTPLMTDTTQFPSGRPFYGFLPSSQILRKNFSLPLQVEKYYKPRSKGKCAMINVQKCCLLCNRDPVLQSAQALTLISFFSGLLLKSDPTVPQLSKLTEDLCLSTTGST